ncbi:MAG: hypothetical protein V3S40_05320 [Kiloniellales bacterium]
MNRVFTRTVPSGTRHPPRRALAAAFAGGLFLAACSGDNAPPPPCPTALPVKDAQHLVRFNGLGRDLTDVLFEAQIVNFALICEYDDDVVEAEMRVRIMASHGPANPERKANFSYFVAIATLDERIVAREEFNLEIPFEGNQRRVVAIEELNPRIPLRQGENGAQYRIYVGLKLSPEELQYNRENR